MIITNSIINNSELKLSMDVVSLVLDSIQSGFIPRTIVVIKNLENKTKIWNDKAKNIFLNWLHSYKFPINTIERILIRFPEINKNRRGI